MCHPICGVRGQRHIDKCYGKNPLASPINDRVLDNWPQAASITSKTFLSCFIRCMCPPHLPGTSCARCKLGIRHGPSFLGASRLMRKGRDLQKGKIRRTYDLVTELWVIWTLENKPWFETLVMHLPMPLLQFPLLQSRARTRVRARWAVASDTNLRRRKQKFSNQNK